MASYSGDVAEKDDQGVHVLSAKKDGGEDSSRTPHGGDTVEDPPPLQFTGSDSKKRKTKAKISDKSRKLNLTDSSTMTSAEQELWQKLEGTMSAKQTQVLHVLEEFGIADVEPQSDALEEQIWRVVQGEITFQEAVDLV
ncbi:hypothetical protein BaRGS_00022160 [Batillaria attramentaria]|uniref:Ribosome assembly protein 3 n=1 Tax=Batillaria attramentaria TaxID=370345 RepID=A0ABD0KI22_9CAEN